jgi:cytochrome P450
MNFHAPAPKVPSRPLNSLEFVLQMARNPLAIWTEAAYREPIIRTEWLGGPILVLSDPAAIRHVMVDNARNYGMQPLRQRVLRPILRDGLLTAEGDLWRRTRKSIAPVFAPRNTTGLATAMRQRALLFAEGLGAQDGQEIDIAHAMTLLTFDILQATLFTGDIAGDPMEFAAATANLLKTMGRVDPMDVLDAPAFVPRLMRLMGSRSQRYFRALIAETIERRQALLQRAPETAPRDLLTLLLEAEGLSRSEIEDNIITFIGAGHETTARALGWTIYLLSQAPDERALVEAELDAFDLGDASPASWNERLPHTRAVFEEAMRLYPPAPSLNRMALEDDDADGTRIPKGAAVLILPWILHRHQRLWSRPGEFVPDRFMPGKREAIDRYQYLPFGIGPRVCIGQSFAMQEGVIALAALLKTLRFDYRGQAAPEPVQKITVQSAGPMPMRVSRR